MALYKYSDYLTPSKHQAFDVFHRPGSTTIYSGMYRCEGCGDDIAANKGNPLPPQNHHQHGRSQGAIRWKLMVFSQSKK
jgi:hypothetical protein